MPTPDFHSRVGPPDLCPPGFLGSTSSSPLLRPPPRLNAGGSGLLPGEPLGSHCPGPKPWLHRSPPGASGSRSLTPLYQPAPWSSRSLRDELMQCYCSRTA